ncbi:DUF4259 domain-containing protein [Streptomyces sp. NPDC097617]|uniref:DUF4259 domain-containing protein n=1 Tax=Streptomyces sp. NPDC097617 TaxID=3366091 RepID=UPI0038098B5C
MWGPRPFDNDSAADLAVALDSAAPEERKTMIRSSLTRGLTTSLAFEGEEAIGAAAVVAAEFPGGRAVGPYGPSAEPAGNLSDLSSLAVRVLTRFIHDDLEESWTWLDPTAKEHWIASLSQMRQVLAVPPLLSNRGPLGKSNFGSRKALDTTTPSSLRLPRIPARRR